jgi:hypothetical protein
MARSIGLGLALQMSDEYGCVGAIVDAKRGAEAFYAKYGFVAVDALEGQSDARPPHPDVPLYPRRQRRGRQGSAKQAVMASWRPAAAPATSDRSTRDWRAGYVDRENQQGGRPNASSIS